MAPTKFPKLLFGTILFLRLATSTFAQSTIQFGFEEFLSGSTPPFISQVPGYNERAPVVANASGSGIPPFDGQKLLAANGTIFVQSPSAELIQSFTLHLFTAPPPPGYTLGLSIAGQQVTINQFNTWQTFQGSFGTPAQSVSIVAYDYLGEKFAHNYAIDAIEFTTVPEPQTFALLSIGLTAIALRPLLKQSANTAAKT